MYSTKRDIVTESFNATVEDKVAIMESGKKKKGPDKNDKR